MLQTEGLENDKHTLGGGRIRNVWCPAEAGLGEALAESLPTQVSDLPAGFCEGSLSELRTSATSRRRPPGAWDRGSLDCRSTFVTMSRPQRSRTTHQHNEGIQTPAVVTFSPVYVYMLRVWAACGNCLAGGRFTEGVVACPYAGLVESLQRVDAGRVGHQVEGPTEDVHVTGVSVAGRLVSLGRPKAADHTQCAMRFFPEFQVDLVESCLHTAVDDQVVVPRR